MITTTRTGGNDAAAHVQPATRARTGPIVALGMAVGLLAAVALAAAPFVPATEAALTGAVLLGFGFGWALLVALSVRFTDRPQHWAAAPAVFMALAGLVSCSGSTTARAVFGWVWPPVLLGLVAWVFVRARRSLGSRPARWLLSPVLATLVVAAVGGGYETVRERLDVRAFPPPGQLIDVGGHRLHLRCTGSGAPTVVVEPGLGGSSADLGWIVPAVARDSRICVYDRAGRGWSDAANGPQDGARIAADLHTLLDRGHVPGPYVLAGHSFGGLYVLSFAAQFPNQVAGMVLLDSTAPKPGPPQLADTDSASVLNRAAALLPAAAHLGAGRLLAHVTYDSLPARAEAEARANASTAGHLRSLIDEELAAPASLREASSLGSLNDKPLIVLTADSGHDQGWRAAQDHLTTLSTNSIHRYAKGTHVSLIDDQADSAAASQAIRDVVDAVRTSQ
ncbi:MAG TPA: alpha/beta hydrolase [Microlunatus sp.]|nr:alpha/beta hydrolase [Microlunatus sp.]